jgi:hypothetical protein
LLPSQFARLHENRWVAPSDRLTTVDDVRACVMHSDVLEPRAGVRYRIALDVGLTHDRTVVAVAHAEPGPDGPTVTLDRMEVFAGSRRKPVDLNVVEETVLMLSRRYNRAPAIFDPFQAVLMAQNLRRRGVQVTEWTFSQQSIARLAVNLYRLLRDRRLFLPDDDDLLSELAAVRLRETSPGVYRLDHDADKHDDRAVALGLVALELAGETQGGPARTSASAVAGRSLPSSVGPAPTIDVNGARVTVPRPRSRPRVHRGMSVQKRTLFEQGIDPRLWRERRRFGR